MRRLLATAALAAVTASACATPTVQVTASPLPVESVVPSPTPSPSAAPSPSPSTSPTPSGRFVLTGEPTDDPRATEPVLAVKIDNAPRAFPQSGLDAADIVYEEVIEGGVTRFLALFHSEVPEVVGPVRSARLVDAEVLPAYRPVLAYSGARGEVTGALADTDAIGLVADPGGDPFFREDGRPSPHNLYVSTVGVLGRGADDSEVAPASSGLVYGPAPEGGAAATALDIRMSGFQETGWDYDVEAEVYRRSSRGEPFEVTGAGRVGAANVVVVLTDLGVGGCCDTAGQSYVETRVTGEGQAVVLRDGRRFDVRWSKPSTDDHLVLQSADGTPLPLAPGPTWIHLAPTGAVERN